jgi:hypothetical protein
VESVHPLLVLFVLHVIGVNALVLVEGGRNVLILEVGQFGQLKTRVMAILNLQEVGENVDSGESVFESARSSVLCVEILDFVEVRILSSSVDS